MAEFTMGMDGLIEGVGTVIGEESSKLQYQLDMAKVRHQALEMRVKALEQMLERLMDDGK